MDGSLSLARRNATMKAKHGITRKTSNSGRVEVGNNITRYMRLSVLCRISVVVSRKNNTTKKHPATAVNTFTSKCNSFCCDRVTYQHRAIYTPGMFQIHSHTLFFYRHFNHAHLAPRKPPENNYASPQWSSIRLRSNGPEFGEPQVHLNIPPYGPLSTFSCLRLSASITQKILRATLLFRSIQLSDILCYSHQPKPHSNHPTWA